MSKDFLNRKLDENRIIDRMIDHKSLEILDPYTIAEELFRRMFDHAEAPEDLDNF